MLLVLSITFIFSTTYGVVYVQLAHLSIGDWKDISIAHVIIIIKSEVSTFPIVFIFFCGCVPEMFVTSYSVIYCIYIPGKPGICIVQFMMSANSRIRFGLQIVFVCLYITPSHYHHCANFIWRHWTYKMPVRYNLLSVWVRLSIFSQLSIIQYVGLCVFSLPISFVMIERIYILCLIIIIKSEVWTITHCLGLGHETMVCAVCLSIFLWHGTKGCESLWCWTQYVTLDFDLTHDLILNSWILKLKFWNRSFFLGMEGLFDLKWKGQESTAWCLLCVTLTFSP